MPHNSKKFIAVSLASMLAGGCSSVGSINGLRMNASTAPDATYCDKHPEVCVAATLLLIGGALAIVSHGDSDSPAPPMGPPPGAG